MSASTAAIAEGHTIDYSNFGPDSVPPVNQQHNLVVVDPDARVLPLPGNNTSLQLVHSETVNNNNTNTVITTNGTGQSAAIDSVNHSVYVIALPAEDKQNTANPNTTTIIDLNQSTQQSAPATTMPIHQQAIRQMHLLPVTTTHDQLHQKLQMDQLKLAEAEARLERDMALKEKRELEKRLAVSDIQRVEEAQLESRLARVNFKRKEEEYSTELQEMMRKVAWYVENQSFNKAQEDLIKEQQETIHNLRLKFQELESLVTRAGVVRTDKDKQIKLLQRKNLELEETIRTRYPNSIPELIRACQPSNTNHSVETRQLKQTIAELEAKLEEKDANYERGIALLRTEADQLRLHYQERMATMEEEMKLRLMTTQTRKVKELEKQLSDTRRYYTEKIKELEAMLSNLRRGGAASGSGTSSFGGPNAVTRSAVLQRNNRANSQSLNRSHTQSSAGGVSIATQTTVDGPIVSQRKFNTLARKYARLREEHSDGDFEGDDVQDEDAEYAHLVDDASPSQRRSHSASSKKSSSSEKASVREALLKRELMELRTVISSGMLGSTDGGKGPILISGDSSVLSLFQQQIHSLQSEIAVHKRLLLEAQEAHKKMILEQEDRIAMIRQQHRKEMAMASDERDEEVRRIKRLHNQELQEVMESAHIGAHKGNPLSNITKMANNASNQQPHGQEGGKMPPLPPFNAASGGNGAAHSSHAATAYLELVTERLHALEHRQKLKELQVAKEVAEIKRLSELEIQSERQKRLLQIEEKNREILRFRSQLDGLLSDLNTLRGVVVQ